MRRGFADDEPGRLSGAYWRQWTASAISNLGDGIALVALPLLATTLTDDPRLIAGVTTAMFVPWLLLSLPAGVIVDRYNRQRLMVATNVARATLMTGLALTVVFDSITIWLLFGLLFGLGICEVIFDNAAQAFTPVIVEPDLLPKANGRLYAAETVTNHFLGQPIGALLFAVGVALPFGIDAVTFAVAAVLIASIRLAPGKLPAGTRGQPTSFWSEMIESLQWLWRHQLLRTLAVLLAIVNLATAVGVSIFVLFATQTLGVSNVWYGVLLAVMSIGAVIGGLIGDRIVRVLGSSLSLQLSYLTFGVSAIALGLSPNYVMATIVSFIDALAVTVWNIVTVSLRQRIIPAILFGRVNSVYRWIGTGASAIGAFIGGQLAHGFGLRAPFVIEGIVILVTFAFGARRLSRRYVEAATSPAAEPTPATV